MNINPSIDFGQILNLVAVVCGGLFVFSSMRADLRGLLTRVTSLEDAVKKQTDILVMLGRQEIRLDSHEKRLDQLELDGR